MVLYHGSDSDFIQFDVNKIKYVGCNGDGFYFTKDPDYAKTYGKIVKAWDVDIKNPLKPDSKILNVQDYIKILNFIWYKSEYKDDLKNYGFFYDSDFKTVRDQLAKDLNNKKDDYYALFDLTHTVTGSLRAVCEIVKKTIGKTYDGVISEGFGEYVAFFPDQIKLINKTVENV